MTPRSVTRPTALLALLGALAACGPAGEVGRDLASDLAAVAGGDASPATVCPALRQAEVGARTDSFTLDFPRAEQRLRTALALYDSAPEAAAACGGVLGRPGALSLLGLTLSSQRRFRLAEAAFDEAETLIAPGLAAGDDDARLEAGRLAAFRAQHALHQERFLAAADGSGEAIELLGVAFGGFGGLGGDLFEADPALLDRQIVAASSRYTAAAASSQRAGQLEREARRARARSEGDRVRQLERERREALAEAQVAIVAAYDAAGEIPGATRARVLAERATVELESGDRGLAVAYATEAADELARELPGTSLSARARLIQAVALEADGRPEDALAAFDAAFEIYAESPAELRYESVWPLIRLATRSAERGRITEAERDGRIFDAAQLVRSIGLASDISRNAAAAAAGDDAASRAIRDWQEADERLRRLYTAAARSDSLAVALQRERIERELAEAVAAERTLRARRDAVAPEYQRILQAPVTLASLQEALRPGEVLLQILHGDPRATVIVVTPDSLRVELVGLETPTLNDLVAFHASRIRPSRAGTIANVVPELALNLYQTLIAPVSAEVTGAERVFVVAGGPLQSVPLETLVTRADPAAFARARAGDYSGLAWLGRETTFSYLPSARSLVDLRARAEPSAASELFLGFGDYVPGISPAVAADPQKAAACADQLADLARLPALPGTAQELDRVAAVLGGGARTVTGAAFTEDRLKALSTGGELSRYRVLHFATHGLLWPQVDCFEALLTASADGSGVEDGLIETNEIRDLDIDAELVVLSACNSADPEEAPGGETLQGLTRAFIGAGARNVLATQWEVSDRTAPEVMEAFYRGAVDGGAPIDVALGRAVAGLRDAPATSHPTFWAPFVVFGDGARTLGG